MDPRTAPRLLTAAACGLLLLGGSVQAAESSTEARLREALRSATAQLASVQSEKDRLESENAALKKQLEELKGKLAAAKPVVRTNDKELAAVKGQLADAAAARDKLAETLAACRKDVADAQKSTSSKEGERARLAGQLGPLNDRLSACEASNGKLYGVAGELLARLSKSGGGEPFLRLKRVELENLVQDYQDRIIDERLPPREAAAGVDAAATP